MSLGVEASGAQDVGQPAASATARPPLRYAISSWLFLRCLGVVFLIAFLSFWAELDAILGGWGIVPAAELVTWADSRPGVASFWDYPSLIWWGADDGSLHALCALGSVTSLLLIIGWRPRLSLASLWGLWLSIAAFADPFMYQWDMLLLEAGFMALWVAPWRSAPRPDPAREPLPMGRWLVIWLLFRLVFSAGVVKLASGDPTWRDLSALDYHYFTQPLPHLGSWYVHQLPGWVGRISVVLVLGTELIAPFLLFVPGRPRRMGAALIAALMLLIMATGNYGWFQLLVLTLCVLCVDDAFWERRLPARMRAWMELHKSAPFELGRAPLWMKAGRLSAGAVLVVTAVIFSTTIFGRATPDLAWEATTAIAPLRTFNRYGLFAVMTRERPEIVIEASQDGEHWEELGFRYKPGDLTRAPVWAQVHMPRVEWRLWFAALGAERWVPRLLRALAQGSPGARGLLDRDPFPDQRYRFVRAVRYEYRFTDSGERSATGRWWSRTRLGEAVPVMELGGAGP